MAVTEEVRAAYERGKAWGQQGVIVQAIDAMIHGNPEKTPETQKAWLKGAHGKRLDE